MIKMNAKRYRIGIEKNKISKWLGWYTNYESDSDAPIQLADAIEKDLRKFRIYEVKPNADISAEKRREIIRAALTHLSKKFNSD